MNSDYVCDIVVIGGGAAGMMAAAHASEQGRQVILVEKNNTLGKKLRITGKGRCNLTNSCSVQDFIRNVPRNGRFMFSSLNRFTPADTIACFESLGVPLKTERGARVFPISDKAEDVVIALIKKLKKSGVFVLNTSAKRICIDSEGVNTVVTDDGKIKCKAIILCTGGASYPLTGSDGSGYELAKTVGHTIIPIKPSLVPLTVAGEECKMMQGLSLKNVVLRVFENGGKCVYEELGELLFTHFGLSGPLTLSASSHMRDMDKLNYFASIDLKPGLNEEKLDARILRDFEKYKNRDFSNSLYDLASKTMIPVLIKRSGIPPDTKINSVTKEQRKNLVKLFKNFTLDITGTRPISEAIITSGGVSVNEVNPKTLQSKLVPGLFFAGEILDVDAYTGGYNLQIAWSTAYAAAEAAVKI